MKILAVLLIIFNCAYADQVAWAFNGGEVEYSDIDYIVYSKKSASFQDKLKITYVEYVEKNQKYCAKNKFKSIKVSSAACRIHTQETGKINFPFFRDSFGRCKKKVNICLKEKIAGEKIPLEKIKTLKLRFSAKHKREFIESEKYKIELDPATGCFKVSPFSANTKNYTIQNTCLKSYIN